MSLLTRLFKGGHGPQSPTRDIAPKPPYAEEEGAEVAIFASGCFWGTEHLFVEHFSHRGLRASAVGYCGGKTSAPSYKQVGSGKTGHAEAVRLEFDPKQISYAALVEFFYRTHDPTTRNAQGADTGSQYRSVIFYLNDEQRDIAQRLTAEVQKIRFDPLEKKIVTELVPAGEWWDAEDEHQKYLFNNPSGYHCPTHKLHW
ncbi:peptide methionine sulfoxide reductase [Exidia glandulosa HHB12029]|uniref:peptide-methionine (S)-S-oxide reductase n=1 Tax=Exidia glandulosa HHB12029 TaxID=1314781 RepID=A0A165BEF1_EXIGL|nr:peptide methionine sulfoxide reductase [Exidia glandulosa HHB12029]